MNRYEAVNLFELIQSAYPGIYAKKARDEKAVEEFISLYMENFGGEPFEIVRAAVSDLIKKSKFPPNISEVWEQVQRQKDLEEFQTREEIEEAEEMSQEDREAFENALIAFYKV